MIDLPLSGRLFTWMNKARTKLSKLYRFLISKEVVETLADVRFTSIDNLWSDHNPILLHVSKSDFGHTPFKLFRSWLLLDSFDDVIKKKLPKREEDNFGRKLLSYEKIHLLKARIKQRHSETKTSDCVTKHYKLQLIESVEEKIKAGSANDDDRDSRIKLLQEVDKLDTFESFDLFQKVRVKWDIEGNENSKNFHGLIKQKSRAQMIHCIMKEGDLILDPSQIKKEFLNFFKEKFKHHDSNVDFPLFANSFGLCCLESHILETSVSLDEVKNTVWDCGSSKAPGPDGFSIAFVKKYWDDIKVNILEYVNIFLDTGLLPHGFKILFFTSSKVITPIFINIFVHSLIGVHYKIIAKILANRLSKVIDNIVSHEQSALHKVVVHILTVPLILGASVDSKTKLLIIKVVF
ncbi:hypothetical protein Tco_0749573 [Tanacetum coccineum]|uniref:RNA-directed DNA polymerase, eukaryota, reverse transcriptase zinc-binding domain protein n=1 Tax=Tanacetum coccineum TaxID=301880 RepID=A0ABQ4Z1I7_9ASTR